MTFACLYGTGKPSKDISDPDYVPSIFTISRDSEGKGRKKVARFKRYTKRKGETDEIEEGLDQSALQEEELSQFHSVSMTTACDQGVNTE